MRPCELTFLKAKRLMDEGALSARELATSVLDRIEAVEEGLGAYIYVRPREHVLAEAAEVDEVRRRGESVGVLAGMPVAVKDNIVTRGVPTTAGSRILEGYVPPYDATAVARLKAAGAVIVGKTNLDEFGMGSSNENSAFHVTRNPWDQNRVPGGSSGGSAAALAACEALLAIGTDTGGSVRQPAGFCGIVGAKPTYGRVSRYGLVAFASSLDQIGVMARDVAGTAALLTVVAGRDPRDATSASEPVPDYLADITEGDLSGVSVGFVEEFFTEGLEPAVRDRVRAAVDLLSDLGASVEAVSMPHVRYGVPAYYLVADAEASSNLARYDGVRFGFRASGAADVRSLYERTRSEGFGPEVKRRIMLGTHALSAGYYDQYYLKAQRVRNLIARDFERAFREVDAVVGPTSPTTAFKLGERIDDPLAMYLSDVFTVPASLAGIPAISVPCGTDDRGLPVGLQIMAGRFQEAVMFKIARAFEEASGGPPDPPIL